MRRTSLCLALSCLLRTALDASETVAVQMADGFDFPVGNGEATGYYKARGYRPNGHLGEDWNGRGGGDTDLGDPVTAAGNGIVVFAEDYKMGWGNVVIVRHAYLEGQEVKYADSLYGHLNEIKIEKGAWVKRGQLLGTIGTAHGKYPAHLHFELRKDLRVGMFRNSFPHDLSVYFDPTTFIATHRKLEGDGRIVAVPINTFPATPPPLHADPLAVPPPVAAGSATTKSGVRRSTYQFDRFEDLRKQGY